MIGANADVQRYTIRDRELILHVRRALADVEAGTSIRELLIDLKRVSVEKQMRRVPASRDKQASSQPTELIGAARTLVKRSRITSGVLSH